MKKINCKCPFDFKELFFFNRLIMPQVITVIYWLALAGVLLSGLGMMFGGYFFMGLLQIILGAIFVRIGFEMICVVFSINRHLEKLVALQSGEQPTEPKDPVAEVVEEALSDDE